MMRDYSDVIFENYEGFLKEHRDDMGTPQGAIEMLSSDGSFRAYMNALTEGLDPNTKSVVLAVAQREREMLLEESINFGPSGSVVGYNVTYFPILTDIYSDPIISQLATTYPVNKSLITIPKVKVRGTVQNTDGTKSSWVMPRDTYLVRGASMNLNLLPNGNNSLFTLASVNAEDANINKRYFMVTGVKLHVTTGGNDFNIVVPISLRPDARGQLSAKFTFVDPNVTLTTPGAGNPTIEGSLIGNIDFNNGGVQYSISYVAPAAGMPAATSYTTDSLTSTIVFSPRKTDIGRVKVSLDIQGWDKCLCSNVKKLC